MAHGLPIRTDVASPSELQRLAKKEPRRRTAQRMLAIANALEGLSEGEQAALVAHVPRGPDPERGDPSSRTLPDLCRFIEARFGKTMRPQSMSRAVRRLGLSRQKARPVHPRRSAKAAETFAKGGSSLP